MPVQVQSGVPDYTSLDLPPAPADRPYVLVNMVMSVDGKVVIEGTEKGLGSKVDQRLMRELRVNADVVINGAGTLRASGTSSRLGDEELERLREKRGKPRFPIAAVVSRSGKLPFDRLFFTARDFKAIIYLTAETPSERVEQARASGRTVHLLQSNDHIREMLGHMRMELKAGVLLLEGGPTLNAEFFRRECVDELFLTIGPVIVGGEKTLTAVEGSDAFSLAEARRLDMVSAWINPETSELYLRYRVRRSE
jgi:riboflavin biosynthesis pyrimidine reductase